MRLKFLVIYFQQTVHLGPPEIDGTACRQGQFIYVSPFRHKANQGTKFTDADKYIKKRT